MNFLDDKFLLDSDFACELYHNYSRKMPIYDYHCHLSAQEIYENKQFNNLYDVWLKEDHYKWRLMRFSGIDEQYITGQSNPYEKFLAYVTAIEYAIDNPLYHWSHLELRRCFGVGDIIKQSNAKMIWDKVNSSIKDNEYSPRKAIEQFDVDTIITTDEVYSSLYYHKLLSEDKSFKTSVLPSFRADKIISFDRNTIMKLQEIRGKITNLRELINALTMQMDLFNANGAIVADLGFESINYIECDYNTANNIFINWWVEGIRLSDKELDKYKTFMVKYLLKEYYKRSWAVLIHIGAKRDNNTALSESIGPNIGCDSISEKPYIDGLFKILDDLNQEDVLGKTVFFNLNPQDNYILTTNIGNFASIKAQMQLGISWWFSDSKIGIERMMGEYASLSNLGNFLGMLTDSRSFISYTRHEYFRRILCNYIANLVIKGEYPNDKVLLKNIITNISFNNAKQFFTK